MNSRVAPININPTGVNSSAIDLVGIIFPPSTAQLDYPARCSVRSRRLDHGLSCVTALAIALIPYHAGEPAKNQVRAGQSFVRPGLVADPGDSSGGPPTHSSLFATRAFETDDSSFHGGGHYVKS